MKDEDGRIRVNLSISHHSFMHDLLSTPCKFCKHISNISSSLLVVVRQMKFLIETINHFTRWEALETTNKIILPGIRREQDRIRKAWAENIYEVLWPYHITPHLTTWENPFAMIGEADIMIPVEITCRLGDVMI